MGSSRVPVHFSITLFFRGCNLGKRRQKGDLSFPKPNIFPAKPGVLPENGRTSPFCQPQVSPKLENIVAQADDIPFALHLLQPSEKKSPNTSHV